MLEATLKPIILWSGILSYISLLCSGLVAVMNKKGFHKISFKWHYYLAYIGLILATIHGLVSILIRVE